MLLLGQRNSSARQSQLPGAEADQVLPGRSSRRALQQLRYVADRSFKGIELQSVDEVLITHRRSA
jgi:hypothetical protein